MINGLVIQCIGNHCVVKLDNGTMCEAIIKGKLRLKGIRSTNPVVVGDRVLLEPIRGEQIDYLYHIVDIVPRTNYIIRRAANLSKESHILAANIDIALLIITLVEPQTSFTFVDRFLASAEAYNIPVVLVINKIDLYQAPQLELLKTWQKIYQPLHYPMVMLSAQTGLGIEMLLPHIQGRIVLLSGHSGVGKSSLINALVPGSNLATQQISTTHQTGMHTTTSSQMIAIPHSQGGGYIIDTPGIKGFGTLEMDKQNTAHYFREFFALSSQCRFNNCTHINEPGCAVLHALDEGEIAPSRYISYLSILNDQEAGKYRPPQ